MNRLEGQVAALEAAMAAVIAAHPNADAVRGVLRRIKEATIAEIDFSQAPEAAAGWRRTIDALIEDPLQRQD